MLFNEYFGLHIRYTIICAFVSLKFEVSNIFSFESFVLGYRSVLEENLHWREFSKGESFISEQEYVRLHDAV